MPNDTTRALQRLHDWAQAQSPNTAFSGDHPIAVARTALASAAQPAPLEADALSRDTIRTIFLAHGFTVKEGQTDLKPYVYEAAEALVRTALASAAPAPAAIGVDAAEALAQHIDTLDSFAETLALSLPAHMHVAALREQLPALVRKMRADFVAATDNNPWETHDAE